MTLKLMCACGKCYENGKLITPVTPVERMDENIHPTELFLEGHLLDKTKGEKR